MRNAMAISVPNSPYIEADNMNKKGSIHANAEYGKNVPHRHVMPCGSQQKEKNNILKDVMIWGEGVGGIVGGWVDKFGHHDGMQVDAVLPKLLESTMMFDVQNISLGGKHAALVTKNGEVFCWGEEKGGRLGHKINIDVSFPKIVEPLIGFHVKSVACGEYQTCAVTDSGELYTWGDNGCGADLMGEERNRSSWLPCKLSGPLEGVNISHVACGEWHTAIASTSGQLFTYGDGTFGVLGHGNLQSVSQPKEVESLKGLWVKSVACGSWHTAAIVDVVVDRFKFNAKVGKLFTWGDGDEGKLGHATQGRKLLPTCVTQLLDHDFVQISCGRMLTVGLTNLGTVYTMGSVVHGQLGNPQAKDKSITVVEGKLKEEFIKEISSGSNHIAVLTSSGSVFTWGKGANGQLGLGDLEDRYSPTLVETLRDRKVESISCGSSFTAAICLHKSVSVSDQSACSGCTLPFGFTRKKHNCYNCGLLFCRACCSKKVTNASLAPDSSKAFRVCNPCFTNLQKITHSGRLLKLESGSPRQLLTQRKVFTDEKEERGDVTPKWSQMLSIRQSCTRGSQYGGRKKLENKGENQYHSEPVSSSGGLPQWGQVPCPPLFKTCCPKNAGAIIPLAENQLSSVLPLHSVSAASSDLNAEKGISKPDEMLMEEVQRLRAEARSLEKQCETRSQKIQECQQQIEETWSLAKEEASKCKAAKEVIKALALKLHTMSEKASSKKEGKDGIHVSLPQIAPVYADRIEGVHHMIVATHLPPEVGLSKDRQVDSLSNTPIVFSDTLKSKYGRQICHEKTRSVENSHDTRTESPKNGINASKPEWVEQYEPGVYITFTSLPSGQKGLKRVRFSRKRFTEREAVRWWEENQVIVYQKYDIEGYSNSS
ncbi:PH, RCC1 and FYVE domains-containing protein 1 isoform X2 [Quercus lobata]|nr:PH, RCC1 and FYVE domains-containing protein 1 isoform X2 [Quercus lobata]